MVLGDWDHPKAIELYAHNSDIEESDNVALWL